VTVLILTEQSNASKPVSNEIEMSFSKQKPIIPLRLREVKPSKMLEFYVSNAQWIDAFFSPLKSRVEEIINIVRAVEAGVAPSPPKPEKKTFAGKVERYLEQSLRHKMITALLAFVVLLGLGGTAAYNALKTQSAVNEKNAAVAQDPSTLGLVKLSAAPGNGAKDDSLAINAAVYLNVKGSTFKDAQIVAAMETDAAAQHINLAEALGLDKGADAQSGVFQIPANTKRVTVCLTTKHPSLQEDYTALWSYQVRGTAGVPEVVREGTPTLTKGVPSICHA
jgi:hypothetical protein